MFALLVALPLPLAGAPPVPAGSFRDLVPRRVNVAAVSSGLAFSLPLAAAGATVPLAVPDAKGSLTLVAAAPRPEPGKLSVALALRNATGGDLSGLRLDVTGATFSGRTKERAALEAADSGIPLPGPLWFGELAAGRDSASVLLEIDFPEGAPLDGTIVLRGVVSGAAVAADPAEEQEAARLFRAQLRSRATCGADVLDGLRGEGLARVESPTLCLRAADGSIWVVDAAAGSVKVYDGRAGFLRSYGPAAGSGVAELAFGDGGTVHGYEAGERPGTAIPLRTLRPF